MRRTYTTIHRRKYFSKWPLKWCSSPFATDRRHYFDGQTRAKKKMHAKHNFCHATHVLFLAPQSTSLTTFWNVILLLHCLNGCKWHDFDGRLPPGQILEQAWGIFVYEVSTGKSVLTNFLVVKRLASLTMPFHATSTYLDPRTVFFRHLGTCLTGACETSTWNAWFLMPPKRLHNTGQVRGKKSHCMQKQSFRKAKKF